MDILRDIRRKSKIAFRHGGGYTLAFKHLQ
jgi:hypothetical protein